MRLLLCVPLLLLLGCPKKDMKTLDEIEREKQLEELFEEDEDMWDDLPEAGEEDES
jgi:hypothetical protein